MRLTLSRALALALVSCLIPWRRANSLPSLVPAARRLQRPKHNYS